MTICESLKFKPEFEKKYFVNDLCCPNKTKILFVLESPHTDELTYKLPASGQTGLAMSKKLFDNKKYQKIPLGRLIGDQTNDNTIKNYGIINVCNFPMQFNAYCLKELENICNSNNILKLAVVNIIREKCYTENKLIDYFELKLKLKEIIGENLNSRLTGYDNNEVLIIPCGKVARWFIDKFYINSSKNVIKFDVPHPSRGLWDNKIKDIKKMKTEINGHLENIKP